MPPDLPQAPKRILLVGWDAADWKVINPLLDSGQMPTLSRLVDGGVMGNLATLHPKISPMLWNSIATGKTADKHGIHGFMEPDPELGVRPAASVSRRTKAIWNIFQQALGWRCNVIGWWASHPAEPLRGTVVTNYFSRTRQTSPGQWNVPPHAVHPPERAAEFAPLRMQADEVTSDLILPFIPRAGEIDQSKERSLEVFARLLSECCSIQAVATAAMERDDWDFTAVYFDSIDHFSHTFMPFHPPRQAHVPERDFELFKDVVAGIYRLQDMMLERLVQLAGPDALVVVCSDHGFHADSLRPLANPQEPAGPILWHRDFGMFVMSGPGVRRDERVYGATLLDIAPTLLTLVGLPVGADMDGRPLLDALENPAPPPKIPSWDDVPGDAGQHPPDFAWQASPEAAQELTQQFAALGYIDDPSSDQKAAAESTSAENRYNLSQVYLSTDKADKAVDLMEELLRDRPWESRYIHQLANAYLKAGYLQAADELLERAYPANSAADTPMIVWLLRARAQFGAGRHDDAAASLRMAMGGMLRHPLAWVEAGWLWSELKDLTKAEQCFRRAAKLDADCAVAWQGLAAVLVRRQRYGEAIDAALEALQLLFHLPLAHFYLGVALFRENRLEEAVVALKRAVAMQPRMAQAHRWLALVQNARGDGNAFLADAHRNEARQSAQGRAKKMAQIRGRAKVSRELPEIPRPAERLAREQKARPLPAAQQEAPSSGRTFVIVSGLPRSGTSLMMQMLGAGGLPAQTDGERVADEDNPEGYLEWEAIKRVRREPEILDQPGLEGRAIKAVSALLPHLPRQHRYKVIFMSRPIREVVRSQTKMIERLGTVGMTADEAALAAELFTHRREMLQLLRASPDAFDLLVVDYPSLVQNPPPWAERVAAFLGAERLPHPERMVGMVRKDLHRQHAPASVEESDAPPAP